MTLSSTNWRIVYRNFLDLYEKRSEVNARRFAWEDTADRMARDECMSLLAAREHLNMLMPEINLEEVQ